MLEGSNTQLAIHFSMFLAQIQTQTTEEQRKKWLPPALKANYWGVYAQTELGHGSNIRAGLQGLRLPLLVCHGGQRHEGLARVREGSLHTCGALQSARAHPAAAGVREHRRLDGCPRRTAPPVDPEQDPRASCNHSPG